MATSGSFNTNTVGNFYFTVSWSRTGYSSVNNEHYISYSVVAHNTAGNYRSVYLKNLVINSSTIFYEAGTSANSKRFYEGTVLTSGNLTIASSNSAGDGNVAISFEAGVGQYPSANCSGSGSWTLDRIPRYGTSNQSLNSKTETSIKMNWSSDNTVDYIWYSTNNGSSWSGVDVGDGTSGTYNITGLSPNTTYNIKTRCRRKDSQLSTDSSTLSVTTYKVPTNAFSSKTETSISMTWSCDSTVDYIWYSKDNGSNWTGLDVTDGTSGNYTISSLSANTTYNIKTRCRRKATQTTYDCTAVSIATYNYPHITAVGTTDLVIGNQQTLTLYNPLSRSVTVKMYKDSTSGTQLYSGTTSTTSIKFTPTASTLYASIPSATSGKCVYSAIYGSASTKTTTGNYTYKIIGTETPTFSTFTYKDTNTTVTGVTGNNQVLVKGLSTLQVTIASANKMVPKNNATGKSYNISIDTLSKDVNYSTSDIVSSIGTVISSGTKRLNVRAYDSRNLSTLAYKDITVYDYAKPVINASVTRLNNFEAQTTIKVSGTYTKLAIGGTNKNTISSVKYRYRETNGTWSSWVTLTTTVSNGTFTCSDVILSLANTKSFEFEIQAVDKLQTTTVKSNLDIGQAIFFVSTNKKACYINGQEILMYDVVSTW